MYAKEKHIKWLHLKSFLANPMRYVQSRKLLCASGVSERWFDAENLQSSWDERTIMIASKVPAGSAVLEFGSGREVLKKHLAEGCRYTPSDIVARTEDTLVCDLNKNFPDLAGRQFDYVVLSGVIEYISDLPALFIKIHETAPHCIVSYAPSDRLSCMSTRQNSGYINHLHESQLLAIFAQAGFQVDEMDSVWDYQRIYSLSRKEV